MMVSENARVRGKIPELFLTLMGPHLEKVDEVISPGLTLLRWTSLNINSFVDNVQKALKELELLVDRVNGIHEHRIQVVFDNMLRVPLCDLSATGTVTITEFTSTTTRLCAEASITLDTKSQVTERAVQELLELLLGREMPLEPPEDETAPGALTMQRRIEQRSKLQQEADSLFLTYEHMNMDTLVHLTRQTLENLRRRVSVTMLTYGEHKFGKQHSDHPLFESDLVLSLPSIVMQPSLDEVQQGLNRAVQMIIAVTKQVYRWGQERQIFNPRARSESSPRARSESRTLVSRSEVRSRGRLTGQVNISSSALHNYFRTVSEHKEVAKLVSMLSTTINSTKTLVMQGLDQFNRYHDLWDVEREKHMAEYMEGSPSVNEFRAEMQHYALQEKVIATEPDSIPAGAIVLSSEQLKIALCAEAKAWCVCYGRMMNRKYQTVMEEVFKSIDDWSKRLSRPLNDLDDIRSVMAALKEIRENEIRIDMSLEPIEVSAQPYCYTVPAPSSAFCCNHWSPY